MALALVDGRGKKRLGDLDRVGGRDDICAEAKDVRAVVLARHGRRVGRRANCRANVLEAARGHRHADSAAANEDAEVCLAGSDGLDGSRNGYGDAIEEEWP